MIKTRDELNLYLTEDRKRNGFDNHRQYLFHLLLGHENAHAYRYIKSLRHCEYYSNNKGVLAKLFYLYYKVKTSKLGAKYHLQIPLNKTGYGLRLIHISGGAFC